jgi:threonine/homoserine/homoserine lactone efflux protein
LRNLPEKESFQAAPCVLTFAHSLAGDPFFSERMDIKRAFPGAMPSLTTWTAFLLAALAMQIVPGPETVLVVSRGVGEGRRVALWTVVGMTLVAGAVQLPLLALGIASIVQSSPLAFALLRAAGALYLVWLGCRLWLAPCPAMTNGLVRNAVPAGAALREGFIANITNPNPLIFMLAFLPQFVDPARGAVTAQLLVLGATQKITGFALLCSMALASGTVAGWLSRRPGFALWQQRIGGGAMIVLGLGLLAGTVRGK